MRLSVTPALPFRGSLFAAVSFDSPDGAFAEAGRSERAGDGLRAFRRFMALSAFRSLGKERGGGLSAPAVARQSARAAIIATVDFCSTVAVGCALS